MHKVNVGILIQAYQIVEKWIYGRLLSIKMKSI